MDECDDINCLVCTNECHGYICSREEFIEFCKTFDCEAIKSTPPEAQIKENV